MRGRAIENLDCPILADTRAILGLPPEEVKPGSVEPCIRCGFCVDHCPVSISPVMITLAAERGLFETAQEYGASFCIACGNCSYVCPSKRPMVELIQYANRYANAR
jgi:electron transport complex protein RnfC